MSKAIDKAPLKIQAGNEGLTDKPTIKDLLGYDKYATSIAKRIIGATGENTPMSIGIYGEWGSGKTSFLMMVSEELQKNNIHPVWFNAWKYEKEDNLWSALIQTILDQAKVKGKWYERIWTKVRIWWDTVTIRAGLWEIARKILPIFARVFLFLLCVAIVFGWASKEIQEYWAQLTAGLKDIPLLGSLQHPNAVKLISAAVAIFTTKPDALIKLFDAKLGIDFTKLQRKRTYQEHIAFLDEFNVEFKRIINLIGKGKPAVIVIDDLDRCLPEKAIQVLETIKLFLDVPGCVFLLAVDKEIVEKAVSVKYKDLLAAQGDSRESPAGSSSFLGENYFDKIVQTPFLLPPISPETIQTFITSLYEDEDIKLNAKTFAAGLPHNARKIKRIINIFLFLRDMAAGQIGEGVIQPALLAKLVIIQHQYRDLYRAIINDPSLLAALETYYRNSSELREGQDDALANVTVDPILKEKVIAYTQQYSSLPLREIFSQAHGGDGLFAHARIENYLYFVKSIAEEKSVASDDVPLDTVMMAQGRYLAYISGISSYIKIPSSNKNLQLLKAYVAPRLSSITSDADQETDAVTVDQAFKMSGKIVILGSPGSGKTTLLNYLAATYAGAMSDSPMSVGNEPPDPSRPQLPILISLSDYSTFALNTKERINSPAPDAIIHYLNDYFIRWNLELPQNFFTTYLEQGKCILLLDGLDGIVENSERLYVAESINALVARYPLNRFVVTVRPVTFNKELQLPKFDYYELLPWSEGQVQTFVDRWFTLLYPAAADRGHAKSLSETIHTREELRSLASNPLMLTLIAEMYSIKGTITVGRSELYRHAVNMLLGRLDAIRGLNDDGIIRFYLNALSAIALNMCEQHVVEVDHAEVVRTLASLRGRPSHDTSTVLSILKESVGLLVEDAPNRYRFITLSFQEYFAARALTDQPIQATLQHIDDPFWREVILFVIDIFAQGNTTATNELFQRLLDGTNPKGVIIAGQYLAEYSPARVDANLRKLVVDAINRLEVDVSVGAEVREEAKLVKERLASSSEKVE